MSDREEQLCRENDQLRGQVEHFKREYNRVREERTKAEDNFLLAMKDKETLEAKNGKLLEALQNMTGLFGEAVTRHKMGNGFTELHAEAVKGAKAAIGEYAPPRPPCPACGSVKANVTCSVCVFSDGPIRVPPAKKFASDGIAPGGPHDVG